MENVVGPCHSCPGQLWGHHPWKRSREMCGCGIWDMGEYDSDGGVVGLFDLFGLFSKLSDSVIP